MASNELLRHFFGGFVRLHILYHAAKETICGVEMIAELKRHGYSLSPGTLYPILHDLEETGYLAVEDEVVGGKRRKNYRITKKGRKLMSEAQAKLRELFAEVIEDRDRMAESTKTERR
jgi:PadR family transcriptional regulator PadR